LVLFAIAIFLIQSRRSEHLHGRKLLTSFSLLESRSNDPRRAGPLFLFQEDSFSEIGARQQNVTSSCRVTSSGAVQGSFYLAVAFVYRQKINGRKKGVGSLETHSTALTLR